MTGMMDLFVKIIVQGMNNATEEGIYICVQITGVER
jgi:hypothetical protein